MDVLYTTVLAAIVATVGWAIIPWPSRAQRTWERIASRLGLSVGPPKRAFPGVLCGSIGGYRVVIESSGLGALLCVQSRGDIPGELRICQSPGAASAAIIKGPPLIALAAMTPDVFCALSRIANDVIVEDGEIRQFIEGPVTERVVEAAHELVALCSALSYSKTSIHERLLARLEADPKIEVLQALLTADREIAERAVELGLAARDPRVLVLAALNAGERGLEPLRALLATDVDEVRAKALLGLGPEAPADLLELLEGAGPWMRAAIAKVAGDREHSEAAERALLALLDDEDLDVQVAAAESLARIGTVASVERLIFSLDMLLAPARLRLAAHQAVGAIQSRMGVADRGRLSVAEPPEKSGAVGFPER